MGHVMTRGELNQNPCNIRISDNAWLGKIIPSTDISFEQFDTIEHGLRAAAKLFLSYYRRYGLDTIQSLINRWSPPSENDTASYIAHVSMIVGIQSTVPIDLTNLTTLTNLVIAVILHENGKNPYPRALVVHACQDAISG